MLSRACANHRLYSPSEAGRSGNWEREPNCRISRRIKSLIRLIIPDNCCNEPDDMLRPLLNGEGSMSSPVQALVSDPNAAALREAAERHSIQWAFETGAVTAAANLIEELQRATNTAVVAAESAYFSAVSQQLAGPDSPDLYTAMVNAASSFGALGDADTDTFPTLYHADGANSLYRYNVSTSWKKVTATAHGLDPADPGTWQPVGSPVYRIWAGEIGTSTAPIDVNMLISTSSVNPLDGWGWWSPSERLAMPSSGSAQRGDEDYFKACQIVSLAPDWYPWGLVGFQYQTQDAAPLKRPEPYDGANPLWVQRPANHPARTGGGAKEMLLGAAVTIADVGPISAWIPSDEIVAALCQAPQVNNYADDLLLAWTDAKTDPQKRVAFWQTTVVEECRGSRRRADRAFNRQAAGETVGADDDE